MAHRYNVGFFVAAAPLARAGTLSIVDLRSRTVATMESEPNMLEQESKTLDETTSEEGEQTEENQEPAADLKAESEDDGPTKTSGQSPDSSDESDSEGTLRSGPTPGATNADDDYGSEQEETAETEPIVEEAAEHYPVAEDDPDIEESATDYGDSNTEEDSDVWVRDEENATDSKEEPAYGDVADEKMPPPPEVSIGISAVQRLPGATPKEPVSSQLDDMTPRVPLEIADDDTIDNADLVEWPVVKDEKAPQDASDELVGELARADGESLDVMDMASGDGDASDPSQSTMMASGDAEGAERTLSLLDAQPAESRNRRDSGNGANDQPNLKATSDDRTKERDAALDAKDQDGEETDETEQDSRPKFELREQPIMADIGLANPVVADMNVQRVARIEDVATQPDPAGAMLDSDSELDAPAKPPADEDDSSPITRPDPASILGNENVAPPLDGPDLAADAARLQDRSIIDPAGGDGGPGPVSDSSGIQSGDSGETTTTTHRDGSTTTTTKFSDGSSVYETTYADGSSEVGADYPDGQFYIEYDDGTIIQGDRNGNIRSGKRNEDGEIDWDEKQSAKEDKEKQANQDDERDDTDGDERENKSQNEAANDDTQTGDANNDQDSASRPVDDGLVDPEKVAAFHQQEAAWQQAIRGASTINPTPDGVDSAEGGGEQPSGVDDPPEDESPRPDDLPEEDPATSGASKGNIDFGPDHVDEGGATASDPRLTEERGAESGQPDSGPVDEELTFTVDPVAAQESVQEMRQAMSGIDPDDVLKFGLAETSDAASTSEDGWGDAALADAVGLSGEIFSSFRSAHSFDDEFSRADFESADDEDTTDDGGDLL